MREFKKINIPIDTHWVCAACAGLLLIAGCTGTDQARRDTSPTERVAGAREEESTASVMRQAGLPDAFVFGGRVWRGHQVHKADRNDVATTAPGGALDVGDAPGPPGAQNQSGAAAIGNYIPVMSFMVQGHQIYRRTGIDEALTDNIYLEAKNVTATGAAGEPQVTFVEYDASGDTMRGMELKKILELAGLPPTISYNGNTWEAKEMEVYDAETFGSLRPAPKQVSGHPAYLGRDKDDLFLQGHVSAKALASAVGAGEAGATVSDGPVFVRYEAK